MKDEHILVRIGKERFNNLTDSVVQLVEDTNANDLLNDFEKYPHAYVLACCMDRQTKAERAWMIPYKIKEELGSFEMKDLVKVSEGKYKKIFVKKGLHRFNDKMASVFYKAVQRIHTVYHDDASEIWKNNPGSAEVVYRFLEFDGVGIKIATMAANILARQYRIPFSDFYSIDVSPDVHVKRVMYRMKLIEKNADNDKVIYKARELYPVFPGIIDYSLWEIGRSWCKAKTPICSDCIVKEECPYAKNIRSKQTT